MKKIVSMLCTFLILSGCQSAPPPDLLKPPAEATKLRSLQSRGYDTRDEKKILSASASALQDMGFTLDESETKLGLIVASKGTDASNKGQVAAVAASMVFCALATGSVSTDAYGNLDDVQKVQASLVSIPGQSKKNTIVRITFQRIVWNKNKQISRLETLEDPSLYQGFYERLSKSVFLEDHQI